MIVNAAENFPIGILQVLMHAYTDEWVDVLHSIYQTSTIPGRLPRAHEPQS